MMVAKRRTGRSQKAEKSDDVRNEEDQNSSKIIGDYDPENDALENENSRDSSYVATEEEEDLVSESFDSTDTESEVETTKRGRKRARKYVEEPSSSEDLGYDDSEGDIADELISFPETCAVPQRGQEDDAVLIPTVAMGDLVGSYIILRAFSWQLRLSPFSFDAFCAAMDSQQPSRIMDEMHVSLLRALAIDEVRSERSERTLNVEYLDFMTWPCFVWEWLAMKGYTIKYTSVEGEEDVEAPEKEGGNTIDDIFSKTNSDLVNTEVKNEEGEEQMNEMTENGQQWLGMRKGKRRRERCRKAVSTRILHYAPWY